MGSINEGASDGLELEENYQWNDDDILDMQFKVLRYSLVEISDRRRSRKMRDEALEWLFNDDLHPFSSQLCAQSHKINIQVIRNTVKRLQLFH